MNKTQKEGNWRWKGRSNWFVAMQAGWSSRLPTASTSQQFFPRLHQRPDPLPAPDFAGSGARSAAGDIIADIIEEPLNGLKKRRIASARHIPTMN